MRAFTDADYSWMHAALNEVMSQIRCPRHKDQKSLEGEIFTRLRTKILSERPSNDDPLRRIFLNRKKNLQFSALRREEKERLTLMFIELKMKYLGQNDPDAAFQELENLLAAMRSNVSVVASAAQKSEEVKRGIEELEKFLETV